MERSGKYLISLFVTSSLFFFWCKEFWIIILLIVYILGKLKHLIYPKLTISSVIIGPKNSLSPSPVKKSKKILQSWKQFLYKKKKLNQSSHWNARNLTFFQYHFTILFYLFMINLWFINNNLLFIKYLLSFLKIPSEKCTFTMTSKSLYITAIKWNKHCR